ncbi:MAG: hypothetical protein M9890_11880 [Thermomicrobiales bacterium]|nr:hypothetical protein [Thermomicrobiales bacterium]
MGWSRSLLPPGIELGDPSRFDHPRAMRYAADADRGLAETMAAGRDQQFAATRARHVLVEAAHHAPCPGGQRDWLPANGNVDPAIIAISAGRVRIAATGGWLSVASPNRWR